MPSIASVDSTQAKKYWKAVIAYFSKREVYHISFWIFATGALFFIERPIDNMQKFASVTTSLGFYAAIVYFNLNYLFPTYLNSKKIFQYVFLFFLAAIIATPLRSFVLYWVFNRSPALQESLLLNQEAIFLSHLAVGASSTMIKIAADWTRNTREQQRLKAQNLHSELRFLRSQVNPHFLFNTLNSLYALSLKKSDKTPETVLKLSDIMRYMLYESNARFVPLKKEVEYVKNYLDLERLRYGAKADITFEIDGEISNQEIAPMLFITFIENSFKHGLSKVIENGYVHIYLLIEEDEIRFHLENKKANVESNYNEPGGIGLINVKRRLDILYPDLYELDTLSTEDTYSVDLYVNLYHDQENINFGKTLSLN